MNITYSKIEYAGEQVARVHADGKATPFYILKRQGQYMVCVAHERRLIQFATDSRWESKEACAARIAGMVQSPAWLPISFCSPLATRQRPLSSARCIWEGLAA